MKLRGVRLNPVRNADKAKAARLKPHLVDPSGTAGIRRRAGADLARRFARLRADVVQAVMRDDLLGAGAGGGLIGNAFFGSAADKVQQFGTWLDAALVRSRLGTALRDLWGSVTLSGYRLGVSRGARAAAPVPSTLPGGPLPPSQPVSAGGQGTTARMLADRAGAEGKAVTDDMRVKMGRVLADGFGGNVSPAALSAQLTKVVDDALTRARLVADTEVVRAHAEGQLDGMTVGGVTGVAARIEWRTAGDGRSCPQCASLAGKTFTLDGARGKIPAHPRCRCAWVPVVKGELGPVGDYDPVTTLADNAAGNQARHPAGSRKGGQFARNPGGSGYVSPHGHDLATGAGLLAHLKQTQAATGISELNVKKIMYLNPNGIQGGKFVAPKGPWASAAEAKGQKLIAILPPGTQIKSKNVTNKDLAAGPLPVGAKTGPITPKPPLPVPMAPVHTAVPPPPVPPPSPPTPAPQPTSPPAVRPAALPPVPEFVDKTYAAANEAACGQMLAKAKGGDIHGLLTHDPGPSPKVKEYKADLLYHAGNALAAAELKAKGPLDKVGTTTAQWTVHVPTKPSQIHPSWAAMDGLQPHQQKYGTAVVRADPATGKTQVLLVKPTNYFSDTSWTWPKGTHDTDSPLATAKKEAAEESGYPVHPVGVLPGLHKEDTHGSLNAYFLCKATGPQSDAHWKANGETAEVKWVDLDQAHAYIAQTNQAVTDGNGTKKANKACYDRDMGVLEAVKASVMSYGNPAVVGLPPPPGTDKLPPLPAEKPKAKQPVPAKPNAFQELVPKAGNLKAAEPIWACPPGADKWKADGREYAKAPLAEAAAKYEAHWPDRPADGGTVTLPNTLHLVDKAVHKEWESSLNQNEKTAVSSWKGSAAGIRSSVVQQLAENKDPTGNAGAIMSAIEKHPPTPGVFYRGIHSAYGEQVAEACITAIGKPGGGLIVDAAPHGMTPAPTVATNFSGGVTVLRVASRSARPIIGVGGYNADKDSENEILGPPGARYRALGVSRNVTINGMKVKYMVDLEEI